MSLIKIDWNPDRTMLRRFAVVATVIFAALAGWVAWRSAIVGVDVPQRAVPWVAGILAALAAWAGVAAAAAPAAIRPVYLALTAIGLPIGFVVSQVVLVGVYYGVLTPIGLILRLAGQDPMRRRFDRSAGTYWDRRDPDVAVERYFRQY